MADLMTLPAVEEAQGRRRRMLRTAFGPTIAAALADPAVIEVMVNPDGRLWIERAMEGRRDTGERIGSAEAERIIRLVAAHVRREVHDRAPIVSAELPETGERFEGVMPPVAPAPCFAVRKPADVLFRLADYVAARIMSVRQAEALALSVRHRKNILVVGGTSSGKTTLVNALLAEVADLNERHPGGHPRVAMRGRGLRSAAHQARCREPGRPGALDPQIATRPHHRRRSKGPRSPRHA
jgi:type IV secretion system protein TrbB